MGGVKCSTSWWEELGEVGAEEWTTEEEEEEEDGEAGESKHASEMNNADVCDSMDGVGMGAICTGMGEV